MQQAAVSSLTCAKVTAMANVHVCVSAAFVHLKHKVILFLQLLFRLLH